MREEVAGWRDAAATPAVWAWLALQLFAALAFVLLGVVLADRPLWAILAATGAVLVISAVRIRLAGAGFAD